MMPRVRPPLPALLLVLIAMSADGAPDPVRQQRYERIVTPAAAGPNRLDVDVPLLAHAMPLRYVAGRTAVGGELEPAFAGGLEDLRFRDRSGREVGYLLVPPPDAAPEWKEGRVLPVLATKFASGFDVDLGKAWSADRLTITGIPAPFLKRYRLEASNDGQHWSLLVADGTLFDLPDEQLTLLAIDFPPGEYRYLRVTWDDRASARTAPPQTVSVRLATRRPATQPVVVPASFRRRASEPGRSRFALQLPGTHLPVIAIEMNVANETLFRHATITEARLAGEEIVSEPLGGALLRRTRHGDLVASDLRIPIRFPQEPELELVVDDGDNAPIEIAGVQVELAPLPWIYFESESAQALVATFGGSKLAAPRYDLEAKREFVSAAEAPLASWDPIEGITSDGGLPAPSIEELGVGAPIETADFKYVRHILTGPPGLTALPLDAAVLAHTPALRDVRVVDQQGKQVPYLWEKRDEPLSVDLAVPQRLEERTNERSADAHVSRYRIRLPYDSMPAGRLVLRTNARIFDRTLSVAVDREASDRRSQHRLDTVAQARWVHADRDKPAQDLVMEILALGSAECDLIVDEGDNTPLPIVGAWLLLPSYRLRFFRASLGDLSLYYGRDDLGAPRYDISLLAPYVMGETAIEASLTPEAAQASGFAGTTPHKGLFWGAIVAASAVLLLLLVRLLLRKEGGVAA